MINIKMAQNKIQDKCRGSLVGGAVGDALGYEVEFMSFSAIHKRFGEKGITRYVLHNAVNHEGDSDSTGAITGNIIGAIHGYSAITDYYLTDFEIEPMLESAADDLCADVKIPDFTQRVGYRYVKHLPVGVDEKCLI